MENKVSNHLITLVERNILNINGIKKLNSFDDKEFFIETIMGLLLIKGESLELIKMDTFSGEISIKGKIDSINYFEEKGKKIKVDTIVSRLFK